MMNWHEYPCGLQMFIVSLRPRSDEVEVECVVDRSDFRIHMKSVAYLLFASSKTSRLSHSGLRLFRTGICTSRRWLASSVRVITCSQQDYGCPETRNPTALKVARDGFPHGNRAARALTPCGRAPARTPPVPARDHVPCRIGSRMGYQPSAKRRAGGFWPPWP